MSKLHLKELLGRANLLLDKGLHIIPGKVIIPNREMEELFDRIDASIPEDIKEAEMILRRREEIQLESQHRADRIIAEAQNEAERILSESELLRAVHQEAAKIKEQVIAECEELKRRAREEAEHYTLKATEEAARIREGAEGYAEQVLDNLEDNLNQLQGVVRNGKDYLSRLKSESYNSSAGLNTLYQDYNEQKPPQNYIIE